MNMNPTSASKSFKRCYLGLGGNLTNELGTPSQHIHKAIQSLQSHPEVSVVKASSLYISTPMGPQDQPDFINAVVEIDTTLTAVDLLALCQQLEQQAQRVRLRHWGERSLDVDILLYADDKIDTEALIVPHPGITQRNFVLIPLAELNPTLKINNTLITDLTLSQDWSGLSRMA